MPTAKGRLTAELIAVLGEGQTRRLFQDFCYQRLVVPHAPVPPDHPLAHCLGDDARLLAQHYGGRCLAIPAGRDLARAERDRAILARRQAGATVGELSQRFGLSRRRVYQILASGRGDKIDDKSGLCFSEYSEKPCIKWR